MTKISYISGIGRDIPANEYRDRGVALPRRKYIPFTQMTEGEVQLALMRNHANALATWAGDRDMAKAAVLLENVLNRGLHQTSGMSGVLSNAEQWAAGVVQSVRLQNRPAVRGRKMWPGYQIAKVGELIPFVSPYVQANRAFAQAHSTLFRAAGYGFFVDAALSAGGYTGQPGGTQPGVRDAFFDRFFDDTRIGKADRERLLNEWKGLLAKFQEQREVEVIYNDFLTDSAHHMLYWPISEKYTMPDRVFSKRLLHETGVFSLANAATVNDSLVRTWLATGIVQKNLEGGVGNLSPVETAFSIGGPAGEALYTNYKKDKLNGIGVLTPQQVDNIKTLVGVAATAAVAILGAVAKARTAKAQLALAQAKGFGTSAYSAAGTDWSGGSTPGGGGSTTGNTNTLLLLGAAAAGAYLLTQD